MKRNAISLCIALLFLGAPLVSAGIIERVEVGVPGNPATRGFARSLSVSLAVPPRYQRGCCYDGKSGEWRGPRYEATLDPSFGSYSEIRWEVSFKKSSRSPETLAHLAASYGWPEVGSGRRRVPHIVANRRVGTLPAFYVLDAETPPAARNEAALVISLGRRVYGVALFILSAPYSNSADPYGEYRVDGTIRPSDWNRAQAGLALDGVAVEGNLPPARVTARASGLNISGAVRDGFGHPLSNVRLVIQVRKGRTWRRDAEAKTDTRGRYALGAKQRGRYRVVATLAGSTARSRGLQVPR